MNNHFKIEIWVPLLKIYIAYLFILHACIIYCVYTSFDCLIGNLKKYLHMVLHIHFQIVILIIRVVMDQYY